jgi:hypothetical protein
MERAARQVFLEEVGGPMTNLVVIAIVAILALRGQVLVADS